MGLTGLPYPFPRSPRAEGEQRESGRRAKPSKEFRDFSWEQKKREREAMKGLG